MPIMEPSVVSKELDYKKVDYIHPTYHIEQIYPQSGITTQTMSSAGGQENIFEIPANVFNLSKSYITFTATIGASGGGIYNAIYRDVCSWFRQIQIYTRNSVMLMDLNELANYTKMVWKSDVNMLEFLELDTDVVGVDQPSTSGASAMLQRSNDTGALGAGTSMRPTITGGTIAQSASSIAYTENRYLTFGTVAVASVINVSIPLRLFKNTICALDKDIYLGEVIQMRVVWNSIGKVYFTATNNAGVGTGAISAVQPIAISQLTLYVATEVNPIITADLQKKVSDGGFQVLVPYIYPTKTALTGSTVNTTLRFSRANGKNLQKIYYGVFRADETANYAYDNNNVPAAGVNPKINYYYTALNGRRLQNYNMQCNAWDDYKLLQEKLKESITQNSNIYNYNQFWVEDFCNSGDLTKENHNLDCGLDLSIEQKWDIFTTIAAAAVTANTVFNHYSYAVTQRVLSVVPSGVQFA